MTKRRYTFVSVIRRRTSSMSVSSNPHPFWVWREDSVFVYLGGWVGGWFDVSYGKNKVGWE